MDGKLDGNREGQLDGNFEGNTVNWEEAKRLQSKYRKHREGIRLDPKMGSVCLICGSIHVLRTAGDPRIMECRNCGFAFMRYLCSVCGETVDERDPANPGCEGCDARLCTCGACGCPTA